MKSFDLIKSKISEKSDILLMFDYDGTLTPIKDSPELAILNKNIKKLLEQLALADFIDIAIITGRQIEILKQLSGITSHNINLYGLHGGETQIKNEIINNISSTKTANFNLFKTSIKEKLKKHNGILIEDKKHTISLHYRLSSEETAYNAIEIFKNEASIFELNKDFKYQEGKKVVELLPKNFNKSRAVTAQINYCPNALPIFFGDDLTDISAFKEVKKHNGIAIGVGDLDFENTIDDRINIHDLEIFLQEIADLLKLRP